MDKDIEELKRRAGLNEETYTMATQEQLDTLVDKERQFINGVSVAIAGLQKSLSGGNTFNPRQIAVSLAKIRSVMVRRMEQLEKYKDTVRKENV